MANSELKGKKYPIPAKVLNSLKINKVDTDYSDSGYISYDNLKKMKHNFDYLYKSDDEIKKNGGEIFKNWVTEYLDFLRKVVKNSKKNKSIVFDNTYNKEHIKNN